MLQRNTIGTPCVLFRRKCLENAGLFNESLTCLISCRRHTLVRGHLQIADARVIHGLYHCVSVVPQRAFDIMGSGGFLLSNYQNDFPEDFTPGEDFEAGRTFALLYVGMIMLTLSM